jgi:hypothetical protein
MKKVATRIDRQQQSLIPSTPDITKVASPNPSILTLAVPSIPKTTNIIPRAIRIDAPSGLLYPDIQVKKKLVSSFKHKFLGYSVFPNLKTDSNLTVHSARVSTREIDLAR